MRHVRPCPAHGPPSTGSGAARARAMRCSDWRGRCCATVPMPTYAQHAASSARDGRRHDACSTEVACKRGEGVGMCVAGSGCVAGSADHPHEAAVISTCHLLVPSSRCRRFHCHTRSVRRRLVVLLSPAFLVSALRVHVRWRRASVPRSACPSSKPPLNTPPHPNTNPSPPGGQYGAPQGGPGYGQPQYGQPQGGYYPPPPQQSYQQPGQYYPQPQPQPVYIQQPPQQKDSGGGCCTACCACLAATICCCCAGDMLF
ncbi:unnamed protein product [Cutaneotrichosporon oleaginosum]